MKERQIHRLYKMIAIRSGDRVLAVTEKSFRELVGRLMPDLDDFERVSFLMARSEMNSAFSRAHAQMMPQWDMQFINRLKVHISEVSELLAFKFDSLEARAYLPDLLEAYRGNHYGEFGWSSDRQLGSDELVFTAATYARPGMLDRFTRRERDPLARHTFKQSSIQSATGTAMRFILKCDGFTLNFAPDGNVLNA